MKKLFAFVAAACLALTMNAEVTTYNVADAIASYDGEGGISQNDVIAIKGVVTKIEFKGKNFAQYGSVCIYVADATGAEGVWEHYNCYSLDSAKFVSSNPAFDATSTSWVQFEKVVDANNVEVWVGDTVVAEGKASYYASSKMHQLAQGCKLTEIIAGVHPEPQPVLDPDTITVAEAITITMDLDSAATSELEYVVRGFVVDAQDFSWGSLQQIFFMADDAENTGAQVFEAYFCTAKENGEAIPVLNGDEIFLRGKLTKYWDKNAATPAFLPELKNGEAEFISKVEGDRSKPEAQTISVADALAAGANLADGATTEEVYNIVGYVTAMAGKNADGGWAQYGNQMFWIADTQDTITGNEKGAFEVYQGVAEMEVKVGYKVSVYTKVKNYKGLLESETKAPVTILEGAKLDTLTVGDAISEALALGDEEISADPCAVVGYVKKDATYSTTYNNITVYMVENIGDEQDLQVYRGVMANPGDLKEGDFVLVIGKLQNHKNSQGENQAQMAQGADVTLLYPAAIENIIVNNPKINKVIMDGVVYIVREGKIYNMQGVQVR